MKIWISAGAAVLIQPLVLTARMAPDLVGSTQPVYGTALMVLAVVVIAAAMALLLGVPAFFLLRKFGREGWGSLGLAGFLIGALPVAFSWPSRMEGFSSGQNWHGRYVSLYVNGVPTEYAWFTYAENVAFFGLHGLIGAIAFYAVWRRLTNCSSRPPSAAAELRRWAA